MEKEFERKYIIGGLFEFGYSTEVYDISFEKMIYTEDQYKSIIDDLNNKGIDYIIFPDFQTYLMPKSIGVSKKIDRLKTMCKNIGWQCIN
ncbi:hypothetical protein [Empedobacter brevis]|uniref:hypothetical protein n=1 Tax=Empedobacter brevis TaxID=247 RepID=UPI00289742A1|nr:hypothetical protein [Empedobacter brevis]